MRRSKKVVASRPGGRQESRLELLRSLVHSESLDDYQKMWLPILQAAAKDPADKQAELLALFDNPPDLNFLIELKPQGVFVRFDERNDIPNDGSKASPANQLKSCWEQTEGNDLAHVLVRTRRASLNKPPDVNRVDVISAEAKRDGMENAASGSSAGHGRYVRNSMPERRKRVRSRDRADPGK